MSLEHSQFTFHSLQAVSKEVFQREVDRITKETDHVEEEVETIPQKKGRYTLNQNDGGDDGTPVQLFQRQHRVISGIVLEVTMENFLCHENMTVKLNKNITFIVGRNGSGKSAILTALVVALGGNANNTGRGAALKDFIRHGQASARVTCVVSNSGPINFKRELYGDTITIVRTLQSYGGSSIRLKSDKGKIISSKMEELRNMTLALGIQVDNPVSVLDQNTARHFLNQSKPTDKFELFVRATNLQTLQDIYVEIATYLDRTNQELGKKERQLVDNNTELLEAQRKHEMVLSLEKDRARETELKVELLWAQVRDCQSLIAKKQKDLVKLSEEKENLDSLLSAEAEVEPLLQQIEASKAEIKVLEVEVKQITNEMKDLQTKYTSAVQMQKRLEQEKIGLKSKLKEGEKTIEDYKSEIRSQEQRMLPEHVDNRRRQRDEIRCLQKYLDEFEAKRKAKEAEVRDLLNNASGLMDHVEQLKIRKRSCEDNIRKMNTQLQGLETEESNLSVFGPFMPALVRKIEGCRQWKKKPVGPLGSYVKVKDPKWALAIESVLKSRLFSFVVETIEDQRRLQQMIRETITRGTQPSVVRTSFPTQPFDTSKTAARTPQYSNVLDQLQISSIVARNLLIDLCSPESTLLIPTDDECFAVLEDVRNVPKNCTKAFTMKACSYFPAPNFRSYGATQRNVKIIQTSRDELLRETQQSLEDAKAKLQVINKELIDAAHAKVTFDSQIKQYRDAMKEISTQYLETKTKLESLKDMEQPDTNSVSVLRDELSLKENEVLEKKRALEEIPLKLEALENEKKELKLLGNNKHQDRNGLNQRVEALEKNKKSMSNRIAEFHTAQATKKRKLDKINQLKEQCTTDFQQLKEQHEKLVADAGKLEEHCQTEAAENNVVFESKMSTKRNVKEVDQELKSLRKRLASVEKILGQNFDNFQREFHDKLRAYNATKSFIQSLKKNSAHLRHALDERRSLYQTQKQLYCGVVSHQFSRVLRFRNCTGNVKINFERKMLEITVGPIDEGERSGKGTSSLSGGERSYATMAFVIALWNVTELPFYYLDEFDVFMDMLNRQTVLTLLLRFALQKKGYQFGFLTPLDTTNIKNSDQVLILKLDDPRKD